MARLGSRQRASPGRYLLINFVRTLRTARLNPSCHVGAKLSGGKVDQKCGRRARGRVAFGDLSDKES